MIENCNRIQRTYLNIIKNGLDLPRNIANIQLEKMLGEYNFNNLIMAKNLTLQEKYEKFLQNK